MRNRFSHDHSGKGEANADPVDSVASRGSNPLQFKLFDKFQRTQRITLEQLKDVVHENYKGRAFSHKLRRMRKSYMPWSQDTMRTVSKKCLLVQQNDGALFLQARHRIKRGTVITPVVGEWTEEHLIRPGHSYVYHKLMGPVAFSLQPNLPVARGPVKSVLLQSAVDMSRVVGFANMIEIVEKDSELVNVDIGFRVYGNELLPVVVARRTLLPNETLVIEKSAFRRGSMLKYQRMPAAECLNRSTIKAARQKLRDFKTNVSEPDVEFGWIAQTVEVMDVLCKMPFDNMCEQEYRRMLADISRLISQGHYHIAYYVTQQLLDAHQDIEGETQDKQTQRSARPTPRTKFVSTISEHSIASYFMLILCSNVRLAMRYLFILGDAENCVSDQQIPQVTERLQPLILECFAKTPKNTTDLCHTLREVVKIFRHARWKGCDVLFFCITKNSFDMDRAVERLHALHESLTPEHDVDETTLLADDLTEEGSVLG